MRQSTRREQRVRFETRVVLERSTKFILLALLLAGCVSRPPTAPGDTSGYEDDGTGDIDQPVMYDI